MQSFRVTVITERPREGYDAIKGAWIMKTVRSERAYRIRALDLDHAREIAQDQLNIIAIADITPEDDHIWDRATMQAGSAERPY